MKNLKLGSLFDGIGAFPYAASFFGITPIWASEILPNSVSITKKHFPEMAHLGDITKLDGGNITPVDILCFGSPCQSFSVAGPRTSFAGKSGLFFEAIRIIQEMRYATNGKYPKIAIFENVPGVLNIDGGRSYKTIIEAFCETEIPMPASGKWANAGMLRGGSVDYAWVCKDAQHYRVPQRRKRLLAIADFTGQRAAEILFKSESLCGYFASRELTRQGTPTDAESGVGSEGCRGITAAFMAGQAKNARSIAYNETLSPTLKGAASGLNQTPSIFCMAMGKNDGITAAHEELSPTFAVHPDIAGTLCGSGAGTSRTAGNCNETDLAVAYCLQGNMIGRADKNGPQGKGVNEELSFSITAADRHAVATFSRQRSDSFKQEDLSSTQTARQYKDATDIICQQVTASVDCRNLSENGEVSGTLQSKCTGGYSLNYQNPVRTGYVIRRLTPIECERLMAFDDGYTAIGHDGKIMSDSTRYQMLGNSIVVNVLAYIMQNIAELLYSEMTE